jgi:hypothetical protein
MTLTALISDALLKVLAEHASAVEVESNTALE